MSPTAPFSWHKYGFCPEGPEATLIVVSKDTPVQPQMNAPLRIGHNASATEPACASSGSVQKRQPKSPVIIRKNSGNTLKFEGLRLMEVWLSKK